MEWRKTRQRGKGRKEQQNEKYGDGKGRGGVIIRKGGEDVSWRKSEKGEVEDEHKEKPNDSIIFHVDSSYSCLLFRKSSIKKCIYLYIYVQLFIWGCLEYIALNGRIISE
jgi:hypothetical protein